MDKAKILNDIKKLKDDDGHWYWIPNHLVNDFNHQLEKIKNKMYMDCPDDFERFTDDFDKYRTMGCLDNMPEFFKQS